MTTPNLKPVTVKFKGQIVEGFIDLNRQPYACPYTKTAPARMLLDAEGKSICGIFAWGGGSKTYSHSLHVEEDGTVIQKEFAQGRNKSGGKPCYKHLVRLY